MQKYILKESAQVTAFAKNIFGDIISKVFYAKENYDFYTEEEIIESIDSTIENSSSNENDLDLGALTLIIEFINGKKVIFTNSEWGDAKPFTDDLIHKIV